MASISIKHLNDDTSWLITFRDSDDSKPFNLVIDPWLCGDQYSITRWFQGGVHLVEPCFPSLPALEREHGDISAILCSIGLTDHTHPNTIFTSRPSVPIFGSKTALSVIDGLHHFDHPAVETRSWDGVRGKPSPDTLRSLIEAAGWEGIEQYELFDRVSALYIPLNRSKGFLMGATIITFATEDRDDPKTYSIIYTPHGSSVATLQATVDSLNTLPHHECLAIISNFDLVHTPPFGLAQPGKENGLTLVKLLNPKFWLRTHDGRKEAKNFIGYFMTTKKYELEDIRKEIEGETEVVVLESGQSQRLL